MSLWRMELARLFRTWRWLGLAASYVAFGVLGPVITRYQEALFGNLGGEITVVVPPPSAPQAVASFTGNAAQIGLIVTIFIAAGSIAFDARPEWAAFLRTRVMVGRLVVPKVTVNAAAAIVSFTLAAAIAWVLTVVLIEDLPTAGMLAGIAYWAIYLGFAVSVVALCAGVSRSVIGTAGFTAVILLVVPIGAEVIGGLKPWMPSTLVGSLTALAEGESSSAFVRAALVAVVAGAACLVGSVRLLSRREL